MQDKTIFESDNFILVSVEKPHVSREEGGHLKISPKIRVADRLDLSPELATEMAWLEMLAGQAMTLALRKRGIDLGIINYQDNKNWGVFKPEGPYLHVHLYGRAKDARVQKYGEAILAPQRDTGFYDNFEPLNDEDIDEIKSQINQLLGEEKFKKENWHI